MIQFQLGFIRAEIKSITFKGRKKKGFYSRVQSFYLLLLCILIWRAHRDGECTKRNRVSVVYLRRIRGSRFQ